MPFRCRLPFEPALFQSSNFSRVSHVNATVLKRTSTSPFLFWLDALLGTLPAFREPCSAKALHILVLWASSQGHGRDARRIWPARGGVDGPSNSFVSHRSRVPYKPRMPQDLASHNCINLCLPTPWKALRLGRRR